MMVSLWLGMQYCWETLNPFQHDFYPSVTTMSLINTVEFIFVLYIWLIFLAFHSDGVTVP